MSDKEEKKKFVVIKRNGRTSPKKHREARNDSSAFGRKRDQDTVDEYLPKPKIKKDDNEKK
jgi:hypothetical protein